MSWRRLPSVLCCKCLVTARHNKFNLCNQTALEALPTPALLVSLHCLPAVALLVWCHRWSGSAVDLGPLGINSLKGSLPSVAIHSLQVRAVVSLRAVGLLRSLKRAPSCKGHWFCTCRCSQHLEP